MFYLLRLTLCFLSFWLVATTNSLAVADETPKGPQLEVSIAADPVTVELISEKDSIQPGQPFWVGIRMVIDKSWHAYWKNPGDSGMAPVITWNLPEGFEAGPIQWPTPTRFSLNSAVAFGYEGEIVFLAQITPPKSLSQANPAEISADMRWVVCSDSSCLPGEAHMSLPLPLAKESSSDTRGTPIIVKARDLIPKQHPSITAQRTEDAIKLSFCDSDKRSFETVNFFPEEKKTIDYKVDNPHQISEDSSQHTLTLKEIASAENKTTSLKGILVLRTADAVESYNVDIPIKKQNATGSLNPGNQVSFQEDSFEFKGGFVLALFFAFIGGLILNLMPCVLPVISFKVLSFIKLAGQSRKLIFRHGMAFSSGVLISFWVLAGVLLALQAYGRSVGWGFQLQEPIFVATLASLLLIFALSLFGLFEMGTSLISAAGQAQGKQSGLFGSFLSGVLATAVATPCTGPFLGSAVGFAVTLPAPLAMLIFTSLGLGMSLPYLLLAAFPSLLRFMPKPGNWMVAFKELMGFFMLATVLWLIWVFGAQTNSFAVSMLLAAFFLMAIACWIYGRWSSQLNKKTTRTISTSIAGLCLIMGAYTAYVSTSPWAEAMGGASLSKTVENETADAWEAFSPERVAELRAQGIPVFIDFTAKWCLICQANHLVLTTDEVNDEFKKRGVVKMKADWTKNDPVIAAELRKFGRNSVPLYLMYDGESSSTPQILPQVLTPDAVVDSMHKKEETE